MSWGTLRKLMLTPVMAAFMVPVLFVGQMGAAYLELRRSESWVGKSVWFGVFVVLFLGMSVCLWMAVPGLIYEKLSGEAVI